MSVENQHKTSLSVCVRVCESVFAHMCDDESDKNREEVLTSYLLLY